MNSTRRPARTAERNARSLSNRCRTGRCIAGNATRYTPRRGRNGSDRRSGQTLFHVLPARGMVFPGDSYLRVGHVLQRSLLIFFILERCLHFWTVERYAKPGHIPKNKTLVKLGIGSTVYGLIGKGVEKGCLLTGIDHPGNSTRRHALIAIRNAKSPLSLPRAGQSIAGIATRSTHPRDATGSEDLAR